MPKKQRRGMVGIEAAIVMIAFVIVGAALAFVALNMGLFATQKTKEVISRGLGEASSALEIDGSVTAYTPNGVNVTVVSFPIKVAPGRQAVDLGTDKAVVRVVVGKTAYENLHKAVFYLNETDSKLYWSNGTVAKDSNNNEITLSSTAIDVMADAVKNATIQSPAVVVIIMKNVNYDAVLEYGEKAVVLLTLNKSSGPVLEPYDKVIVEVRPPEGAPLTVERTIPATLPTGGGAVELY